MTGSHQNENEEKWKCREGPLHRKIGSIRLQANY